MRPYLTMLDAQEAAQAIHDGRARAFRLACGLSLREAGSLIGVGRMTVYMWEASRRTPHPAIATAYVSALLVEMAQEAS
jgi:DNA-binding XRE family transcriptional regulator